MVMAQLTLSACIKMVAIVAFASASTGTGIVLDDADSQYEQKITGDNTGYPDESDYLIYRVGIAAGAGIVIALFSCICGVCFCCVQTCSSMCKCCERNCSCCGAGEPVRAPSPYISIEELHNHRFRLLSVLSPQMSPLCCAFILGAGSPRLHCGPTTLLGDYAVYWLGNDCDRS